MNMPILEMLRRSMLALSLLLVAGTISWCCPQTSEKQLAPAPPRQEVVLHTKTELVMVDVSIEDKKTGEPIKDLQELDFVIKDNGKPLSVSSFSRGMDHSLRPIQLWFELTCNEQVSYVPEAGRYSPPTLVLGPRFLAGKTTELAGALAMLGTQELVGVAHWCDNGESEIDLAPTVNRQAPLEAVEKVAARQTVLIRGGRSGSSAEIVLRMINDITRTAFPEPFPTIVAIGGKPSGSGAADGSSGLVDFSSLNFGLEESGAPSSSEESRYSVKHNEYGRRLSALVELLHNRYEVGFQPTTNGKKLHRISVTLTKNARERYPDAMLRYRETYSAEPQADQTQNAKYASNWRQLDSRMLAAVTSAQNLDEIGVNVSQARARDASEFVVKLGADHLTWQALPNGYRQNAVMAVIASYSAEGKPMGLVVKDIEIKQDLARVPAPEDDFVTFSLRLPVEKASTRIRVLVRDVASGRIGSQDLPQTGN